MANYATLIAAIRETIAANGNNEITGPILQQVLVSITNALGSGYQFIGIATPSTTPGTPDQKVFYIGASGTYPNFGPAEIPDGNLAVFYYDSTWHYGTVAFPIGNGAVTELKLATTLANKLFAEGYKFAGVATPQTTPGTPDQNVFYVGAAGQYSNFGSPAKTVAAGYLGFFKYNNGWTLETVAVGKDYDAEIQAIKDDLYGTDVVHVTGSIVVANGTSYNGIMINNSTQKFASSTSVISWLYPLQDNTTYVVNFNALGCWAIVKNSTITNGATVIWGDNYPYTASQNINAGDYPTAITIVGKSGNYLYLRADTASGGRAFPSSVTFDKVEGGTTGIFVLKESVTDAITENDPNPVSSGAVFEAIDEIKGYLPKVCDETGRVNIDWNALTFSNKQPNTTSNINTRVLSNLILPINRATSLNTRLKSDSGMWVNMLVYDASQAAWIDKAGSSTGGIQAGELATITYPVPFQSSGIRLYIGKTSGENISASEAKAAIQELYYTVPTGCEMVPAASEEYVDNAVANVKREISILFIGNSLTQDAVSYVPFLLKNLRPNVSFKFYMWYNGGYTLAQQYTKFTNNQACEIFSVCENGTQWQNTNNSVKMADILSTYTFDIVCLQEYFNYKATYTESDLVDFNNCVDYIRSHYAHNFKVISLFHAPKRSSAASIFAITKSGNELILKKTVAESLLAPGVAVYRALSTDLDSLGDQGHLSPDGTHTQEGLPCLLQAFVVFIWIMRQLAIPASIENCQLRMTTAIYNALSVPGPNLGTGVIQGTDAQNLLAQDVAILADKEGQGMLFESFIAIGQ